jgi:hypothetical protein
MGLLPFKSLSPYLTSGASTYYNCTGYSIKKVNRCVAFWKTKRPPRSKAVHIPGALHGKGMNSPAAEQRGIYKGNETPQAVGN